jgi:hypothetical protein
MVCHILMHLRSRIFTSRGKFLGASVVMFAFTMYLICRGRTYNEINCCNVSRCSTLLIISTLVSRSVLHSYKTSTILGCSIFP